MRSVLIIFILFYGGGRTLRGCTGKKIWEACKRIEEWKLLLDRVGFYLNSATFRQRAFPSMKYWLCTRDVRKPDVFWEGVPDFTQICFLPLSDKSQHVLADRRH